jgi:hypothetical protein
MNMNQIKNIERTKKQKIAKITSELGLVIFCLFIIMAPIAGSLTMTGTINRYDLAIVAIILIIGAFILSIISLSFFFMTWIDNKYFKNRGSNSDAIYFLLAIGTFFISLSFLIVPILIPSD